MTVSKRRNIAILAGLSIACMLLITSRQTVEAMPPGGGGGGPPGATINGFVVKFVNFKLQGVKLATVEAYHPFLGLVCTTTTGSNGDWQCDDVPAADFYTVVGTKTTAEEICGGSFTWGPVRQNRTTTIPAIIMECRPPFP